MTSPPPKRPLLLAAHWRPVVAMGFAAHALAAYVYNTAILAVGISLLASAVSR